jgi:hypothetical protein
MSSIGCGGLRRRPARARRPSQTALCQTKHIAPARPWQTLAGSIGQAQFATRVWQARSLPDSCLAEAARDHIFILQPHFSTHISIARCVGSSRHREGGGDWCPTQSVAHECRCCRSQCCRSQCCRRSSTHCQTTNESNNNPLVACVARRPGLGPEREGEREQRERES